MSIPGRVLWFVSVAFLLSSCDSNSPEHGDNTWDNTILGTIHLENQGDHSGVLVDVQRGTQRWRVATDAGGNFSVRVPAEGEYLIRASYPYFAPDSLFFTLERKKTSEAKAEFELQQLIRVELEHLDDEKETPEIDVDNFVDGFLLQTTNLTNDTIRVSGAIGGPNRPAGFFHAFIPADPDMSLAEECATNMGFRYEATASYSVAPVEYYPEAKHGLLWGLKSRNFNAKNYPDPACLPPGDYLLYVSWPDQRNYPDHFIGDETVTQADEEQHALQQMLRRSLLSKPELIKPVRVRLK